MNRSIKSGIAMTLVGAGLILGSAGSASAYASNCTAGYSCHWGGPDYQTSGQQAGLLDFTLNYRNFAVENYPGTGTNGAQSASSVYNNGNSSKSQYFAGIDYGYPTFVLNIHTGDADLSNGAYSQNGSFWSGALVNDKLSSGKFV